MERLTLEVLLRLALIAVAACIVANTVYVIATGR